MGFQTRPPHQRLTAVGDELVDAVNQVGNRSCPSTLPGSKQRVGLDHHTLLAQHQRLVYASLTAYGLEGPDRDAPGYDMAAFSGRSGLADRATPPGAAPPILPGGVGDNVTAITLVSGIMGALYHRERSGQGQLVSTSLLRTGIYSIGMDVATRVGLGRIAPPPPRTKPQNPLMNTYCAADGKWFWLVGAESERHWPGIVLALGNPALENDERFATPRERRRNATALVATLDALTAKHTRSEWAARATARAMCGISAPTAAATLASSRFMTRSRASVSSASRSASSELIASVVS